jgi:hypothetical protein
MKTPEELAEEFADEWHKDCDYPPEILRHTKKATASVFLAGYQAGRSNSEAVQAAAPQWISVKDRLPEDHKHYLVISKIGIVQAPVFYNGCSYWDTELAYYSQRYARWMTGAPTLKDVPENKVTFDVTHWMPLPKSPEE